MVYGEVLSFAYETFCSNKVRFALTALGMVIGTASLILVVTIGMTGKQYVLSQIQSIGTNQIEAEYQSGGQRIANVTPDPLTIDDMNAAMEEVPGIVAASPVVPLGERIPVGGGKERDISVLGVFSDYRIVRNLVVITGRFFDSKDSQEHNKVGVITQKMAEELYGSQEEAIGKIIKLSGLPFTIVGTFREQIRRVIKSRHRAESVYQVMNLTQLVQLAEKTANALTLVLLLVAAVVLLVSGIGIMNIMLATVSSRIREIGIRKALGATNREIRFQFLAEAMTISLVGGLIGVVIGLAIPYSVRFLTEYRIPISGLSAIVAILVSSFVGVIFGTVPATRAAKLDPVESLRYE
jgi:putative ABC transport system permease protein